MKDGLLKANVCIVLMSSPLSQFILARFACLIYWIMFRLEHFDFTKSDLLQLLRTEGRGAVNVVIVEPVSMLQPLKLISNDASKGGPLHYFIVQVWLCEYQWQRLR